MSPLGNALGLALLHFVWQGLVLGAVIAGTLAALRDRPASVRYLVCVGGMALLMIVPVATTWLLFRAPAGAWSTLLVPLPALHGTQLASRLASPLLPLLPMLPIVWGAGVLTLQVRMIAAWFRADSLRRAGTRPAALRWQREFDQLCTRLAIPGAVRLRESSRVAVPAVIGWLKPVVLVPTSLATGLGADEIRGLLAHELAHVRRHDYVVNLAQCLFESLLFFHPVTWWLSGRLRAEREFCCDDVALTVGGGAFAYARTLSSLEELRDRTALPVLSARGGSLMMRIMRILGGGTHRRSRGALFVGVVTVVSGVTLGSLMAAGCFRGDTANADPSAAVFGPGDDAAAVTDANAAPGDGARVLQLLQTAVADEKLSAEMFAVVRDKIESGEARFFSAECGPDGECTLPVECLADCDPANCSSVDGAAAGTGQTCLELIGSGGEEPVCVVIQCDSEADCAALGATATANGTALVEFSELTP